MSQHAEANTQHRETIRTWLAENEIEFEETDSGMFSFALPGEKKLQTPVRIDVGEHALGIHAFVCRNPDENHEGVFRWLLEKNLRLFGVAFAVDRHGDIYRSEEQTSELQSLMRISYAVFCLKKQ